MWTRAVTGKVVPEIEGERFGWLVTANQQPEITLRSVRALTKCEAGRSAGWVSGYNLVAKPGGLASVCCGLPSLVAALVTLSM